MPYLGNSHVVGDHINNFKVLDDISSYTETFDGTATSVVSVADDTIRVPNHRFIQGQRVIYNNGGGSNISGLTSGTPYYIIFNSNTSFKLATSAANAANGVVVNILGVASSGTSHTINASFDGFNTRFKITHSSGKRARFINPSQLTIAINNVVQRPNLDHSNFNEGFAIQHKEIIVFKNAPSVNEVFWGNLIGETIETFDISDLKVDNHTGDGSTQVFSLSRRVPNNESVMVSLDGVLQHPTDSTTERSYSTDGNLLTFVSAPANGVEIQIRHLGYAGAATGEVSGFYGRTGNVTLNSNDDITTRDISSRNINVTGITTISQNLALNASGTTYPLVVHADADYKGIMVNGSYAPTIGFNILDNATPSWKLGIHGSSHHNFALSTGTGNSNKLIIQGASNGGKGLFYGDWFATNLSMAGSLYHDGDTDTAIQFGTDLINLKTGNVNRIVINNTSVTIPGNLVVDGVLTYDDVKNVDSIGIVTARNGIDCNGDIDVDGHSNLDNVSIAGVTSTSNNFNITSPSAIVDNKNLLRISGGTAGFSASNDANKRFGIQFDACAYDANIRERTGARIYMEKEGSWNYGHSPGSYSAWGALVFQTSRAQSFGTEEAREAKIQERLRITSTGNVGIGTSRPGSKLDVIGDGNITGVVTATAFKGDGTYLTGIAGFATALSLNPADPLNSIMYHDSVMGIGSTLTIDHPSSATAAFTRFGDIRIDDDADLIIGSGDDFIPDVLGLNDFATIGGGSGDGRIRANRYTNRGANGAPIIENGANITGVVTATGADINGDLDVDGHTNLDNVSVAGVSTFASDVAIGRSMYHVNDIDTSIGFPQNGTVRISGNNLNIAEFTALGTPSATFNTKINATGGTVSIAPTISSNTLPVLTVRNNTQSYDTVLNFQNTNARSSVIQWNNYNNTSTAGNLIFRSMNSPNTEYARFTGAGNFNLLKDLDVDGHTNLDNVSIAGVCTATTFSGSGASLTSIANANISNSAAIAGSKITPNFGSQTLTAGLVYAGGLNSSGGLSLNGGTVDLNFNRTNHTPTYRMVLTGGSNPTMNFRIRDTTNSVDRFLIRHAGQIEIPGDVGIGHPVNFSATNISKFGNYSTLHIKGPSNEGAAIRLQDNADTADSDDFVIYKNHVGGYLRINGTDPIIAYMNGAERLRITSAGNVGINTSIPSATLEVSDVGSTGPLLLLNGASSTEGDICVDHDENLQIGHWNKSTSTFTQRMSIPSHGYVQGNINVPCFFGEQDAAHNITNATWTKLINFGNEPVNIGGAFAESTGVFTVGTGQAGTYVFYGGGGIDDIQDADYVEIVFVKNGSQIGPYSRTHCSAANNVADTQLTFVCSMSEGNTMELHIRHNEGTTEATEPNRCFFGGYRLAV